MLETGKFAFDTVNSASVQILEKIEAWGYTSYRVFNPATGTVYKVTADQLKEDGGTNRPEAWRAFGGRDLECA